ncbi:MAG: protein kinase [Elainella sp. Prado103]|nr:protein kinase [Elainella sp. Prado103]
MSLCINPRCPQPDHPGNDGSQFCQSCGSELLLLKRYRVMRLISDQSGFGRVYEVFDRSTPKILKVLKETYSHHPKAIELFRQEAIVLGQLPHPGIPAVEPQSYFEYYPQGATEPLHCLLMEKIDGPNLKEWMRQQGHHPISERQAIRWLRQLAQILQLVHQCHYFHRDIKPENIMLRSNGQLVLVDFGAAREMTYTYLAQRGETGGTRISSAGYTPPEQERGQAVPQSDFYALGYTLIYLVTGKLPVDPAIYDSMRNESCWRQAAPQISDDLATLIDGLIAPRASDRPQTATEILRRLAIIEASTLTASASPARSDSPGADPVANPVADPGANLGANPGAKTTQMLPSPLAQAPTVMPPLSRLPWWLGGAAILLITLGSYGIWRGNPGAILQATQGRSIKVVRSIPDQGGTVRGLAFTPDGQRLITGGDDQTIRVWGVSNGQPVLSLPGHTSTVKSVVVKSDGSTLASSSDDQTIRLWNLGMGQPLQVLTGHTSYINQIGFSPDGQSLVSASADQTVRLWDLQTGQARTFLGHTSYVNAVVFSPDGRFLASASADQTARLWDRQTGQAIRQFQGHSSYVNDLIFTPDGQRLITASADQTIRVWDVNTGEVLRTLQGHHGFVERLAISPDGQRLLSGGADQTLKLWNLETGQVIQTLTGFNAHIRQFVPSPDWQTVAVATGSTITIAQLPR